MQIFVAWGLVAALLVSAWIVSVAGPRSTAVEVRGVHHNGRPLRVLLIGDSLAGTLGVGLAKAAPASDVALVDAATPGCSVGIGYDGAWASSIWVPAAPAPPCQSKEQLLSYWQGFLKRYSPDVVIYLSRMDTNDQEVKPGSTDMQSVLDPSFDVYLTDALESAVGVLSSRGARVILGTSPPTLLNQVGNGNDDPSRWAVFASILKTVVSRSGGRASVFDFTSFFGGSGSNPKFLLTSPTGVQWRCTDGIHFTEAGGIMVAPSLFDRAWNLGAGQVAATPDMAPIPGKVANAPWRYFAAQSGAMGCLPRR